MLEIYLTHFIIATIFVGMNIMWILNVFVFPKPWKDGGLSTKPIKLENKSNTHQV